MAAGEIRAGRAFVEMNARLDPLQAGLTRARQMLARFHAGVAAISPSGALSVGGGIAAAVTVFSGYQDNLAKLRATAAPTAAELRAIEAAADGMSRTLGIAPRQAVAAMTELLRAGMPLETVLGGAAQAALQFAKVAEIDVARAAVVAADAVKVFARENLSASQALDILSAAADASSTDISGITLGFSQASAAFGLAGQGLADLAAAMALLANAGIKGSDAGTSLRTMMLRLMAPVDDGARAIAELGLQTRDAGGRMLGLPALLGELRDKLGGLNDTARDDALRRIFGADAIRAAATLLRAGPQGFEQTRSAMQQAQGVAQKYGTLMETLSGQVQTLASAGERLANVLGAALSPTLQAVLGLLGGVAGTAATLLAPFSGLLGTAVGLGAAGLALRLAWGPAAALFGGLLTAVSGVGKALLLLDVISATGQLPRMSGLWLALSAGVSKAGGALGAVTAAAGAAGGALSVLKVALLSVFSNPLLLTVLAIGAGIAAIGYAAWRAAGGVRELRKEAEQARAALRERQMRERTDLQRLAALDGRQLTPAEMDEARDLVREIAKSYAAFNITLDETALRLRGVAAATAAVLEQQKKQAKAAAEKQEKEARENVAKLNAQIDELNLYEARGGTMRAGLQQREELLRQRAQQRRAELEAARELARLEADPAAAAAGGGGAGAADAAAAAAQRLADERAATELELAQRLAEVRINGMAAGLAREEALLEQRYDVERQRLLDQNASSDAMFTLEETRLIELANLRAQHNRERAAAEAQLQHENRMLAIEAIEDPHQRALAAIAEREQFELKAAEAAGQAWEAPYIKARATLQRTAAEQARLERQRTAATNFDRGLRDDAREAALRAKFGDGPEFERARLDAQEQDALAGARRAGGDDELVRRYYELRRMMLEQGQGLAAQLSSGGAFGIAALGLGAGGNPLRPLEQSSQRSAELLEKSAQVLERIERNTREVAEYE